jgi:predicted nucleotidyltransferase
MVKKRKNKVDSESDYDSSNPGTTKPKYEPSKIEKVAGANSTNPSKAIDEFELLASKLPKDAQKKLRDIKVKLDKLKKGLLGKFDKYIMGITLIPPQAPPQGAPAAPGMPPGQGQAPIPPTLKPQAAKMPPSPTQVEKQLNPVPSAQGQQSQVPPQDQINVMILVDDSDSKKMTKEELRLKLSAVIQNMASDIDKKIITRCVILSEVWQNCYDGKYDLIQKIAGSAPMYDTGMLAALRISEIHMQMVLKKFERYIVSYVLAGSLMQGRATEKSDIDVFIVVDDTDVKRMSRIELKDKLRAIIIGMGIEAGEITGVRNKLNIQVYILTDFWESVKDANPIIFTFLRDGVPLYDRGTFMPWKQLLQMGRIKPSSEAIDLYMSSGEQLLDRVKLKLKEIGMEDLFWSIITPTQAAIMLYGIPPPTPKETPEVVRDVFVKKEKLLEESYVSTLSKVIKIRKDLEHGDIKEVNGAEIDKLLVSCDKYLKRIGELFKQIQEMKEKDDIVKNYDNAVTMIRDALKLEGIAKVTDSKLVSTFEDELISKNKISAKFIRSLHNIIKSKKDYEDNKLTRADIERAKKESKEFSAALLEFTQRKRGKEVERAKIRIKHGDKYGEVILLDNEAFIVKDIDQIQKEVSKAKITDEGGISSISESSPEELENVLANAKIPPKTFIKEKIFEDLRKLFGKNVEILINY